ncbi:MAG TPA: DUF4349 domain-containing protein [Phycisphaerae bacterium]|nr:DUF4349 domain-containing protein [Phycisphaerae bacterium]
MYPRVLRGSQGLFFIVVPAILALVLPIGCAEARYPMSPVHAGPPSEGTRPPAKVASGAASADVSTPSLEAAANAAPLLNAAPPQTGEKRIVVYTAALTIVVPEVEAALKQVEALAAEYGGWVQEIRGDRISIRVPAAAYSDAEARVESLGRVTSRQLEAADVTEEYVDLEARLKNAMAVRERLSALLAKAETVQAALEVEKELNRVGEEIERLQAKIELLKSRVAYSTITVSFERIYRSAPTPQLMKLPFPWLHELDPKRLTLDY